MQIQGYDSPRRGTNKARDGKIQALADKELRLRLTQTQALQRSSVGKKKKKKTRRIYWRPEYTAKEFVLSSEDNMELLKIF